MPLDPTVLIVFGTLLVALLSSLLYAAWYQQFKHKAKSGAQEASRSIGVGELEALIARAVAEATLPLDERFAALESEVRSLRRARTDETAGSRPASPQGPLLSLPDEEREEPATAVPSARRVR